jgi:tetratricopeptide (TPR) repeat protein
MVRYFEMHPKHPFSMESKRMESNSVKVWEEDITIPTYLVGKPEKNPIFLENRVYQGSSGVVYPHPVVEKISDEKTDKIYHALFLENRYLKIMILPELGGRIQMAYDKIRQRHFIYYNQVIKPALVGLTGPWISGGIEFNWPQHHRPSTFDPIDFTIEEHADGSKTVWVSEVERMFRTKGMAGFRLYPEKAYLEINAKLFNRTPFPQTFLWWANPAVKVNDNYQTVFPPDVHAVFDHGKRDVSEFPIAKGTYYKVDYSKGVDISRYKNIPVPTSYMAIKSNYDFMGGYEHDSKAGLLHVANHHVSPGKKQWTWGNGEFGYAWDRNLTDEDGPYIELMTGVFTDNQPDFSWIQPNEERTFTQYFMPYTELGVVKNATKDGMVNMEVDGNEIKVGFYTTSKHNRATAVLLHGGHEIWREEISISPASPFLKTIPLKDVIRKEKINITLYDGSGKVLVSYQPEMEVPKEMPPAAQAAKEPAEIKGIEQLFLTGLHIEQYRHATYKATDYYEEALRREPSDVRNNNALGLWHLKRGKFMLAEKHFAKALETLSRRNPNPYNGEPYFNLGLTQFMQGDFEKAFESFYKSAWSAAWQDAAYLHLARIATRKGDLEEALDLITKSLNRNYTSPTARHLKVIILRKLGRDNEALTLISDSLAVDKFNVGCLFEEYVIYKQSTFTQQAEQSLSLLKKLTRGNIQTHIEYAFDYAHAGMYEEASEILFIALNPREVANTYPMAHYYLGYFALKLDNKEQALLYFKEAQKDKPDYCFPNRIEDVGILETVMTANPTDAKAPYYLGNFWYANRHYSEAIACWEKSIAMDASFPTAHRNLALAYHNKQNNFSKALQFLERAFELDTTDARVLMELDQLYKKLNKPHKDRLNLLEKYIDLTISRDDLYLERIALCNHLGLHQKALELINTRKFHPWEGGEGKVVGQYLIANIEQAKKELEEQKYIEALSFLTQAEDYPENLGEGKLYGAQENDIHFLTGCAYEGLGDLKQAKEYFQKTVHGVSIPVQAIYYNDPQPDKIFYQGLAWKKLGETKKAEAIFNRLIEFGKAHLDDTIKIDYFAVSLPDLLVFDQDLNQRNKNHCHYLMGLGYLGLNNGKMEEAEEHFAIVLDNDINHFGAALHSKVLKNLMPIP